jgi:hypothetical protein
VLVVVALSVGLPVAAHAGTSGTAVLLDDKHSKDPGHGGGRPGPSQTPPTTSTPSPVPSDPAQSPTPGDPTPTATEGGKGVPPPSDKASPPAPAPVPVGGVASGPSIAPPGNDVGAPSPAMLGRQLSQSAPATHAAVPAVAPAFDPNDTVRIGGTAMPLWLIVGSGGLLVVLMAVGLVLTLRDRDHESDLDGLGILEPRDPPASVKFG